MPVKCPICGRPFVDMNRLAEHQFICAKGEQERLDKEWKRQEEARL